MQVAEWIKYRPGQAITIAPEAQRQEILALFLNHPGLRDIYVVAKTGKVLGHITFAQMAHVCLAHHRPRHTRRQMMQRVAEGQAQELMRTHFTSAQADERLIDVLHRQLQHGVEDLPVLDAAHSLLGTVNLTEVLRELQAPGGLEL